ncbi:pyridoxamine 5'-phosphate oxidase [Polaribacter aestuariivivens]|uniref:Pyridoxine/pyridoxamine 5'-phosphate oxidase n=1 Tax=Polaribacter aestuariivivens TaxID=2304626 RepID=A0A5S3N1C7_9FLAO|nr:pyridoxamine 5'-phosphate oxidase [Polaribacter aestuariivivens]TMM29035.1 pyridoxamine 5'-phosphate oxidase [Polaribacter aestuariivivens]
MPKDLSNYRKSYEKQELLESNCPENPMELFQTWFRNADESDAVEETNAMTVATIGKDGFPKSRVVLLKKFTWEGFIFYTNYTSEKGKAIADNNNICLSFFWPVLEQQIIIKGKAEKLAENLSDGYFESRPDGSKLGAWASNQSNVVASRDELDATLKNFEKKFENNEIPRPKHWGGYLVKPISIEFWQGRPNRMHDRIRYSLQKDFSWKLERLAP